MSKINYKENCRLKGGDQMNIVLALILNSLALLATAYIVPGFKVADVQTAVLAAIVLGVVNTFIKPALIFLTAPLTVLTLGLFAFVVNAIVLWIVAAFVGGVTIDGLLPAILAAVVLSVVSTALSTLVKDINKRR